MSYNSGEIGLVISNQPRATRSANLKLLAPLLHELYSTQSYYHYKLVDLHVRHKHKLNTKPAGGGGGGDSHKSDGLVWFGTP